MEAARRAAARGISLDNLDALKAQVFAPPGPIYDGAGSGWESLAVGPDCRLYPSPALVGVEALAADLAPDLETAWKESPPRRDSGCLVCGAPLLYLDVGSPVRCHYCQDTVLANAVCEEPLCLRCLPHP